MKKGSSIIYQELYQIEAIKRVFGNNLTIKEKPKKSKPKKIDKYYTKTYEESFSKSKLYKDYQSKLV